MLQESLEDTIEKSTYRILSVEAGSADRYLQFKSTKRVRNFPDFWNTHEKEVWRFVPVEQDHIFNYLSEGQCPTQLPLIGCGSFINCFHGQEGYDNGPINFTRRFPNIQDYFKHFNALRDKYLAEKERQTVLPKITPL